MKGVPILLAKCTHCFWRGWWLRTDSGISAHGVAKPGICPDCGKRLMVAEGKAPDGSKFVPAETYKVMP